MSMKVGFIGMGIMGQPMAKNVLKSGFQVMVYNRTQKKTAPLKEAGALVAETPKEIAQWADVTILMLTGPEAITDILHSENNLLNGLKKGDTLISMGTIPPRFTRELNELLSSRSITFIDAPVSGSKKPAEDGTLIILAGGPQDIIKEYESLFLSMGQRIIYCGTAGQGSDMKMTVNLLLAAMMEGFCEALNFGEKAGLSLDTILDTILPGPLGCGLFNLKADMLKSNNYTAQFPLKHMTKDLRYVLQTADSIGAAIPVGHCLYQVFRHGEGMALGEMDIAAVKKVLENRSD